jgi:hypothetical protein
MEAEANYRKPKSLHLAHKPVEYSAGVLSSKLQPSVTTTENAVGVNISLSCILAEHGTVPLGKLSLSLCEMVG